MNTYLALSQISLPPSLPPYHKRNHSRDPLRAGSMHGRHKQQQLDNPVINGLVAALENIHVKAADRVEDLKEGGREGQ